MGCDIHCFSERFDGKKWVLAPSEMSKDDKKFYAKMKMRMHEENGWRLYLLNSKEHEGKLHFFGGDLPINLKSEEEKWTLIPIYGHRNYYLFGVLAGVRTDDVEHGMIAAPRGLPKDLSDEVRLFHDTCWKLDAHTRSWLTVPEILKYFSQNFKNKQERKWCEEFVSRVRELKEKYPHDKLRLVFWFDN